MNFSQLIIDWYHQNKRDLPWRNTKDPYKIWLSEIILQQTRVEQGREYYEKFIYKYPTINDLSESNEEEVLNLWQGLGYYSRARNLHFSAKYIVNELDGVFPSSYRKLLQLKGVGVYTAAAIASFSYNEVVPVVDGNVYRVLSRCYGIDQPIDTNKGQKYFFELAKELIPEDNPSDFNQAIMEFGALHCTPHHPQCDTCIFSNICVANATNKHQNYPIKKGKTKVQMRYLTYWVFLASGKVLIRKRNKDSIWANLYDFPCIETKSTTTISTLLRDNEWLRTAIQNHEIQEIITYKHLLSHRKIMATFYWVKTLPQATTSMGNTKEISVKDFANFPVSKLVDKFWHHFSKQQAVGKQLKDQCL